MKIAGAGGGVGSLSTGTTPRSPDLSKLDLIASFNAAAISLVGDPSSGVLGVEESNAMLASVGVSSVEGVTSPRSSVATETGGVLDLERSGVEVTELARFMTGRKMAGQLVAARRIGGRVVGAWT